jgi:hypothetical protein
VSYEPGPISTFPLPEGWSAPERVEDAVDADGARLFRVGLASSSVYGEAVGSAADWISSPAERSAYELLERIALLEAAAAPESLWTTRAAGGDSIGVVRGSEVFPASPEPTRWTHARSSGVALHVDWKNACIRAEQELIERDRLQRSWLGEIVPRVVPLDPLPLPLSSTRSYDWRAYSFPANYDDGTGIDVVGIFGFPTTPNAPLVFGYGARHSPERALEAAVSEAAQLLAFLWGEPIPDALPEPGPTPMAHLERFQFPPMHERLRRWLGGGHRAYRGGLPTPAPMAHATRFVDLTPSWSKGRFAVARAIGGAALPLTFGRAPVFGHLPDDLCMHPIP